MDNRTSAVAIDGITVQKMKVHPHVDTELQSFQVFGLICVSIVTSFSSGFIIDSIGLQWLYAIVATIALAASIAAVALREKRDLSARLSPIAFWNSLKLVFSSFRDPTYTKIFLYEGISSFNFQLTGVMIYWYDDVARYSKGFQVRENKSWILPNIGGVNHCFLCAGTSLRLCLIQSVLVPGCSPRALSHSHAGCGQHRELDCGINRGDCVHLLHEVLEISNNSLPHAAACVRHLRTRHHPRGCREGRLLGPLYRTYVVHTHANTQTHITHRPGLFGR